MVVDVDGLVGADSPLLADEEESPAVAAAGLSTDGFDPPATEGRASAFRESVL